MLLDAFGWAFVQRHADHPFLKRLEIEPVASQFPSTTTAHLTTLYTGLPVAAARALRVGQSTSRRWTRSILPLPFVTAEGEPLELDPRTVVPGPTVFEQLDVPARVLQPAAIATGKYNPAAFAGATVEPYDALRGRRRAARRPRPG